MREPGKRTPHGGNPFVPEDFESMTAEHRRSYALRLIETRETLRGLLSTSSDWEALTALIAEVDAALVTLRAGDDDAVR